MLWPESDTIAAKLPQLATAIGQVDKLLAENSGSTLPFSHVEIFCREDRQRLLRILKEYVSAGIVIEVRIAKCPEHPDVTELILPGIEGIYCDQCEKEIEESNWEVEIAYQVALRSFLSESQAQVIAKPPVDRRFAIALSFPGKHREYVRSVAIKLAEGVGQSNVLFDEFHKAEFSRPNLDTHLQGLYLRESSLVVVFLCEAYEDNEWCGLEWRAIRNMIKEGRENELMFIRLDDGHVEGIFGIDGFVDAQNTPLTEVVSLIQQRMNQLLAPGRFARPLTGYSNFQNDLPKNAVGLILRSALSRNTERWVLLQPSLGQDAATVSAQFDQANHWLLRADRMMGYATSICLHAAICCLGAAIKELFEQSNTSELLLIEVCQSMAKATQSECLVTTENVSELYGGSSELRSAMRILGFDASDLEHVRE